MLKCETEEECDRLEEEYFGDGEGLNDNLTASSQQFSDTRPSGNEAGQL